MTVLIALLFSANLFAEYSNASLAGAWYIPASSSSEEEIYMIFDEKGIITEFGGYNIVNNGTNVGTYTVTPSGQVTINLTVDNSLYTNTGQFFTLDSISGFSGEELAYMVKIPDIGTLAGYWSGSISNSDYSGNFYISIDNTGKITSPSSYFGHVFTRKGKVIGFIATNNGSDCWGQMQFADCIFLKDNISGKMIADCSDINGSIFLSRFSTQMYSYKEITPKFYYIIGMGDGKWNNSSKGLGASYYPMSIVTGNQYDANGNGIFTYTGYFLSTNQFKLIGGNLDWLEQWGNDGIPGINNPIHNYLLSSNFQVPADGLYIITLNSISNTLSIKQLTSYIPTWYSTIGLIGDMSNWMNEVTMNPVGPLYNHVWYTNYTFASNCIVDQGVKFRANNDWSTNWGCADFPYGIGSQDGANIPYTAGTYTIFFNDVSGTYYFFKQSTSAVKEVNSKFISIYPNPASNYIYIKGLTTEVTTRITNLNGELVTTESVHNNSINISSLPTGIYFLHIETQEGIVMKMFIKE